jgi:UTP--glucose-1-phosphate uridylyltransferase
MTTRGDVRPFAERMLAEGLTPLQVEQFRYYYGLLRDGDTGTIGEDSIEPVEGVATYADVTKYADAGRRAIGRAVILKLNGGLGTSMGLERAKTLLMAREGLTFLDIIARQSLALSERHGEQVELMFLNSFSTEADTLAALSRYPHLRSDLPLSVLQSKIPKVLQEHLAPAVYPAAPDLEWCPPGHGEIYRVLSETGTLDALLAADYEFMFLSNADNLGATLDPAILGYMAETGAPFLMEVAERTESDKKGGHVTRLAGNGRLVLREVAQCADADMAAFQDIRRHRYFNTNNIWVHLPRLKEVLDANGGWLKLPMIRNAKTLDPRDSASPPVYQLETAMGAAIGIFAGAQVLQVGRDRFVPVKTCSDLLVLRSDCYSLDAGFDLQFDPARAGVPPSVSLDANFYKLIDAFEARFPHPPSLRACTKLTVKGDVRFGQDVVCRGAAEVANETAEQKTVPAATLIEDATLVL